MPQISKAAVAGVWPVEFGEANITVKFPSIASTGFGRFLGTIYGMPFPIGFFIHLATVPFPIMAAIGMYLFTGFRRYQLTSTHVRVVKGIRGTESAKVHLGDLDEVRSVVRPGQAYYRAGDLELVSRGQVALTLTGAPNVESFRNNIQEARDAYVQVREVLLLQQPSRSEPAPIATPA